jgi:hypothetical protein
VDTSDLDLMAYLGRCAPVELHTLITLMKSRLSPQSQKLAARYPSPERVPQAGDEERRPLAQEVAGLLAWFGSNTVGYGARRLMRQDGGAPYARILRDVARQLNLSLKRRDRLKLPRLASIAEWEEIIVNLLLAGTLKGKTPDELAPMLVEAGLEEDAARAAARRFGPGMVAVGLPLLVSTLGEKGVVLVLEQVLVAVAYRFVGKEAAGTIAKALLAGLARRSWTPVVAAAGWVLVGIDVLRFATAPATRVTIPCVAALSVFRMRERLAQGPKRRRRSRGKGG